MAIFSKLEKKEEKQIKNVVTYTRVSTRDQVLGFSLGKQMFDIQEECKKNDYKIIDHFADEGISGKTAINRPAYQKMLTYIENNKTDAIIIWKLSRISRKVKDLLDLVEILDSKNIALISIKDGLNTSNSQFSKILLMVLGMVAELEGDNIVIQSNAGMVQRAEQGRFMGGVAPFGYRYSKNELGLEIDDEKANIVKKIFTDFAILNKTLTEIRKELETIDINLTKSTMSYLLKNPIYTGKFEWNKKNKNERTLTSQNEEWRIVEDDIFQLTQEKLGLNNKKNIREDGKYLLSGLIACPICGKTLTGDKGTSKSGKSYEYYSCKNKQHKRYTIKKNDTEKFVLDEVGKSLKNGDFANKIKNQDYNSKILELDKIIKNTEKTININRKKIKETIDLCLDGTISKNELKLANEERNNIINNLQVELEKYKEERENFINSQLAKEDIEVLLLNFASVFTKSKLSIEEKNRLIKLIIKSINLEISSDYKVKKIKEIELSFTNESVRLQSNWQGVQESNP